MAARQGTQSNAMLYSLITFVALFIIATVCAVIFYVKSEEYRTTGESDASKLNEVAGAEKNQLARVVGKPADGKSYLGTTIKIVDDLYSTILGKEVPVDTPATVKFNEIQMVAEETKKNLGGYSDAALGPDGFAILLTVNNLKEQLDLLDEEKKAQEELVEDLQLSLKDASTQLEQEREQYVADLEQLRTEVDQVRNRFDSLRTTWEQATNDQIQTYEDKLETVEANLRTKQLQLEETEKKLADTDQLLGDALVKLDEIKPKPNIEVQAYKPDANIVRVDLQNSIVYLNVGTKNHIYRGLTFAIYDRNQPIPETGEGKAEIEIFQINEQASAARIVKSDPKNPIVKEDIVSNLIWDSATSNRFVVVGDFDLNNDGRAESDGRQRIIEMIERWGGSIKDEVTVDTDFIVVGISPSVLARPTQEEVDIDPMAQQRYELSVQKSNDYNALLQKANNLNVPVFNQRRFMYLTGYETLASKNPM